MANGESLKFGYRDSIVHCDGRLFYGEESKCLFPCTRITDPALLVGIIDYNNLPAKRFLVASKDRTPIRLKLPQIQQEAELTYPGKSAFLYFHGDPTREVVSVLVQKNLKRVQERTDHLHLTSVSKAEEAGWQVWWAPLPDRDNWLHLRLIPDCIIESGKSPTLEQAQALKEAFSKAY